jgi:hypothetical protein
MISLALGYGIERVEVVYTRASLLLAGWTSPLHQKIPRLASPVELRPLLPPPELLAAAPSSGHALMTAGYDLRVQ